MTSGPHILLRMRCLKRNLLALWFACRHPSTPLPAKMLAVLVAGHAFSPIDLVPGFLPLVGISTSSSCCPARSI